MRAHRALEPREPFEAEGLDIDARVRHDIGHDGWIARNVGCRRLSWARADPDRGAVGEAWAPRSWAMDAVLYGVSALFAGLTAAAAQIPLQQTWGGAAFWAYAGAALIAALAAWTSRRSTGDGARHLRRRTILVLAVFVATALAPMAVAAVRRVDHPGAHAQSEVIIVEEAAAATLEGEDPYAVEYRDGPLSARPEATADPLPVPAGHAPVRDAAGARRPRSLDRCSGVVHRSSRSSPRASASSGCRPSELRGSGSSRCSSPFPPGLSSSRREGSTSP